VLLETIDLAFEPPGPLVVLHGGGVPGPFDV
jgi:hypothetical protein